MSMGGLLPGNATLVLDHFRAFRPPAHWDLGLNIQWMTILLVHWTSGVFPTIHDRL